MTRLAPILGGIVVAGLASPGRAAAQTDDDMPAPAVNVAPSGGAAPAPVAERPPPVRFTVGLLGGTGYGRSSGTGDVNADVEFSGGSWARLGHLVPVVGLLFPRARLFVAASARAQIITGTTDVYASNFVAHARRSAYAWFSTAGWFPRQPEAQLQPYVSLSSGIGRIAHLARFPTLTNCGPNRNETCIDTVVGGPYFVGAGTGLRWRLHDHLDAVVALEAQLGEPDFTLNLDGNLGLAVNF